MCIALQPVVYARYRSTPHENDDAQVIQPVTERGVPRAAIPGYVAGGGEQEADGDAERVDGEDDDVGERC